ncbi:enoyl-CoA hydratase/isomerase family protein [Variovorax boronicumulans]|uniref:enoyl-CoA hydratase/isomerase family protein n=1 Tax=Variovorax boronicumulans TaxID=436515 RepID=UPI0036F3EC1B
MGHQPHNGIAVAGITLQLQDAVATIAIDLPQPKNSFRVENAKALGAQLDAALEGGARCVVLRGAGAVFSAGWDIGSIDPAADDPMAMISQVIGPLCQQLRALPVPTIAAVAGPALGFGFGLALCCDMVLAEEEALFGSPFRHIGMVPDTGAHHILLSRTGFALASELIYTGRLVNGAEAAALRLVNRAVPTGAVAEEAQKLAQNIASGPTAAFRLSKEVLLEGGDFDSMLAHEARQLQKVFATDDLKEGIAAFQQRRRPAFTGR